MDQHIMVAEEGGVMEIRINRPDKKNALTAAMYRSMIAALEVASNRSDVAAVLIAAEGDAFCAGNDLGDFMAGPEGAAAAFDFIQTIARFQKPLVAAVQGLAVGVGTTMLLHCDLIYAVPEASFVMPFVNLGLVPEAGSSLLAPALMGRPKAAAMLMLGEPVDAAAADKAGLITDIVERNQLLAHARRKAAVLATRAPAALAATRRLIRGDQAALEARMLEEAQLFREALNGGEAREALSAFFQKREPVFSRS